MKEIKAHDYKEVYQWLGLNLNTLGCVMLDLEKIEIPMSMYVNMGSLVPNIPLYESSSKERFWIKGWVAGDVPHITLLYGLIETAKNYEVHIQKVLEGWELNEVEIEDVGYFASPYDDEDYWCIVAHIKKTPELLGGHSRLEFLPHINTFMGYKPHMTLCYIKKVDEEQRDLLISDFKKEFVGRKLKVAAGLNLGGN